MKTIIWALFGNDEDGPYGFYPHTTWGAIRWWLRNPFHNLTFHVLNWPGGPFWSWKYKGWNGYIGFRPHPNGVFGIAVRRGDKKYGEK